MKTFLLLNISLDTSAFVFVPMYLLKIILQCSFAKVKVAFKGGSLLFERHTQRERVGKIYPTHQRIKPWHSDCLSGIGVTLVQEPKEDNHLLESQHFLILIVTYSGSAKVRNKLNRVAGKDLSAYSAVSLADEGTGVLHIWTSGFTFVQPVHVQVNKSTLWWFVLSFILGITHSEQGCILVSVFQIYL